MAVVWEIDTDERPGCFSCVAIFLSQLGTYVGRVKQGGRQYFDDRWRLNIGTGQEPVSARDDWGPVLMARMCVFREFLQPSLRCPVRCWALAPNIWSTGGVIAEEEVIGVHLVQVRVGIRGPGEDEVRLI